MLAETQLTCRKGRNAPDQWGISYFLLAGVLEIEAVAQDHLADQMVGRSCHANPQPEIHFPLGGEIQVNGRENLLLLLSDGIEPGHRPQRPIILKSCRHFLRNVVAQLHIR